MCARQTRSISEQLADPVRVLQIFSSFYLCGDQSKHTRGFSVAFVDVLFYNRLLVAMVTATPK